MFPVSESDGLLLMTAFTSAGVHSLIPDHWLPIVLVGRREGWPLRKVMRVTALSGAFHLVLSLVLGLFIYVAGEKIYFLGHDFERASHALLIAFGLGYIFYDYGFGHGRMAFREPQHGEAAHLPKVRGTVPWILAAVVGLNPCVLVAPLLVAAMAQGGFRTSILTLTVFSLTTAAALLASTATGYKGTQRFHARWLERYGGALSGGLVALLGIVLWWERG